MPDVHWMGSFSLTKKGKICKQEIFVNHGKEEGFFFQRTDLSRKRVIGIQIFVCDIFKMAAIL